MSPSSVQRVVDNRFRCYATAVVPGLTAQKGGRGRGAHRPPTCLGSTARRRLPTDFGLSGVATALTRPQDTALSRTGTSSSSNEHFEQNEPSLQQLSKHAAGLAELEIHRLRALGEQTLTQGSQARPPSTPLSVQTYAAVSWRPASNICEKARAAVQSPEPEKSRPDIRKPRFGETEVFRVACVSSPKRAVGQRTLEIECDYCGNCYERGLIRKIGKITWQCIDCQGGAGLITGIS
eukprot:TRINITY_DN23235_c0_g1_i1.p1 TRINITY_DN23235_c0_g1~~TRINITY_DN23235_c0_g1_i1.p1  ORF type:complete len:250 (-),score=30.39 TRINITY_DN23235_c0_g1_i1:52-759(-)